MSALFALLLLSACGPNKGDVYEHEITSKRVKIERMGACVELKKSAERGREIAFEIGKKSGMTKREVVEAGLAAYATMRDSDSTETDCLSYREKIRVKGMVVAHEKIETTEDFLEDHRAID